MKIYFAGPNVFFPNAKEMELHITAYCQSIGVEALIPGDSGIDWTNPDLSVIARQIFEINRNHIHTADAIVANTTPFRGACVDDGTSWEIGYAAALNKPIATYAMGFPETGTTITSICGIDPNFTSPRRDSQKNLIEEFGFQSNLMIACSTTAHFHCDFDIYSAIVDAVRQPIDFLIRTTMQQ